MNDYTVYMHISPSNKRYIGITSKKPEHRWGKNGSGYKSQVFYKAIEKYGWENIEHIIIAKGLDEETAKWLEIELIKEWNTTNPSKGYNITLGGEGTKGINPLDYMTEEAKIERSKKMSEIMSGENNPMYGKTSWDYMSKETKEKTKIKISESNKSVIHSKDWNKKISKTRMEKGLAKGENNPMYGKHHTEEWKRKYSGENHPRAKSVICITTGKIFNTAKEGAEYYGCDNSCLIRCCKGRYKSAGKLSDGTPLVWKYIIIIEL